MNYGTIASAKVSIDANFTSRGFGFVSFENSKAAQKAIKEANGVPHSKLLGDSNHSDSEQAVDLVSEILDEKKLVVSDYLPRQDRNGTTKPKCSTNLYVKNFPLKDAGEFCEDDLKAIFHEYGEIASVALMRDEEHKSKGFGFVCFKDWQDAQKALNAFADQRAKGTSTLYVTEFKTKEQRKTEIEKKTYQFKKSM